MGNIGFPELIVILIIALLLFGAGRLPEIGSQIGKSIKSFKDAMKDEDKKKVFGSWSLVFSGCRCWSLTNNCVKEKM